MELQVVTKKENPLLKRVEVTFKAIHKSEATPTRDAIRAELAKQLKAGKDTVVVDRSVSSFGRFETTGYAKVYRSKEEALAVERSHILVRNRLKEPEVKEKKEGEKAQKPEKPAKAEPKAEAPKAEHKAEHKEEAKPEHKEDKAAPKEEKKPAEKHEEKKEAKPESKKAEPKKKEGK